MFVGHYAAGFAIKKRFQDIPLWLIFIAVQFVDILAFSFVLLGIETISYNPTPNPFLRTSIDYVPFSHSLFYNLIFAVFVFSLFRRFRSFQWGIGLSIGVLSHWFLDAIVHVKDLPLFLNSYKAGLGLWKLPMTAFVVELSMLLIAAVYFLPYLKKKKIHIFIVGFLTLGFCGMFFAPEQEATPQAASIMSLSLYAVVTGLAFWAERKKETV
jgi:hypothetical protein